MRGEGKILTMDTRYGKISSVICFDMDFPDLIRQAGEAGVDVMFNPANDCEEVAFIRMQMAMFRAIENGFSVVRLTSNGFSVAADYQGRVLATTDYFTSEDPVMISYVPTEGVRTTYSRIGDLFAWLCMAGFVAVLGWAVVRRKAA